MFHLIVSSPSVGTSFVEGKGLGDMMDKYLVHSRNRADLAPGTGVLLAKEVNGVLHKLRRFGTPTVVAKALEAQAPVTTPALKLSDAMRQALDSDDSGLTGVSGKANTLKALESRGLVKIHNDGVARFTDLGRQYRSQGR